MPKTPSSFRLSLSVLAGSFLLWGVLRSLDDVLVALFHATGTIRYATAMLIHFSFFSAYLLISIPAGMYVRTHGYRSGLTMSLTLMALGSAVCVPAVRFYSFPLCLAGIFVMALGIAALQTTANPCIGLLGPENTAASRLLIVQGFSSLGSMLGPLAGTVLFGTWSLHSASLPLVFPSRLLAGIYLSLAVLLAFSVFATRRWFADRQVQMRDTTAGMGWHLLRRRRILFGITAAFLYVGSEATLLGNSIPYLSHHYSQGFLPATAAVLLSVYWGSVLLGRICAVSLLRGLQTRILLQGACILSLLLIVFSLYRGGTAGGLCLLSTGLCNAVMFPSIFTLSVTGLRKEELPHASALLSTAICGGAAMPVLSGLLADRFGIGFAFILPCIAYVVIGICSGIFFPRTYHLRNA